MTTIIVIAKECIAGRVKTRLHPPLSFEQAAELASAALSDTIAVIATLPATRHILFFDGTNAPLGSESFELLPQAGGGLDERLGAIFDDCSGPTVLVGMDTPQLDAAMLLPFFTEWPSGVDAILGFANDGGYWTIGMAEPDGDLIRGIPMSTTDTGRHQLDRLLNAGLEVQMLPELVDFDTIDDARLVAAVAPDTEFARTFASFDLQDNA